MSKTGRIFIGIGGWTYADWRGPFYPEGLTQKHELEYAASKLTSIEINGTFYGSQKPESFRKWHDETPEDFVFALKGPRFATNRRVLAEAGSSIDRFFDSGVLELKDKLGPVNWQLAPTKQFEAVDFEAFLKLLPVSVNGRTIRHAVEVRHESFRSPEPIAIARAQNIAIVFAGDSKYPEIADATAPFIYARIMGTSEQEPLGYSQSSLDTWIARAKAWAQGDEPADMKRVDPTDKTATAPRDVYLYVISGFKEKNPLAAMAMIDRL